MSSLLFSAYKLNRQNSQPENVCDIIFEKAKCHGSTVNRTSVYGEAAVQRVPWKRCFEKFTRKHMCLNHFFGAFLWILRIFSDKNVQLWSFFCPVFPVFGLNTEIYGVNLHTQSEYRKIRTWKNSVFGHFSRNETKAYVLIRVRSVSGQCRWKNGFRSSRLQASD